MAGGVRDEVGEQDRLVMLGQLVVVERRVGLGERPLGLPGEPLPQLVAVRAGRQPRIEQRPRLGDPLLPGRPRRAGASAASAA